MQIVIPMSGFGERFKEVGYRIPKPLIEIEGKPIIAHVVDMFPGEKDFIFVCNEDHLNETNYRMAKILREICPTGRILGIPPHKLGPIHAVRQVEQFLEMDKQVVVNYCDFTCYWDWKNFKRFVKTTKCVGSIPAYKGFHPHSLGKTNYAYIKEKDGLALDIQEKEPFTDNKMEEYASSGTYYFSTAKEMSDAFAYIVEKDINVGGEYYVSLAYKPLFEAKKSVTVYPLQHFMQWGTPQDVDEYNMWSNSFSKLIKRETVLEEPYGSLIIPMAGLGQRFAKESFPLTKPLIPVSGKPMVTQATADLPKSEKQVFILRTDMPGFKNISHELKTQYPDSILKKIKKVTDGQACTALIGYSALKEKSNGTVKGPLTIGACDNGLIYNQSKFKEMVDDKNVDVIVWAVRGYPNAVRNPHMFGWIDEHNGKINKISVKTPLENPETDPIVLGTFTFSNGEDFKNCVERLVRRNGRVNNEFYLDSCLNDAIELGLKCYIFEVDSYLCWGTPDELRTFEYWQSCFHKWPVHPYRLEKDIRISERHINLLSQRFAHKFVEGG